MLLHGGQERRVEVGRGADVVLDHHIGRGDLHQGHPGRGRCSLDGRCVGLGLSVRWVTVMCSAMLIVLIRFR